MYWTLELAISLEDAPWPATKEELIDYAMRSGAPMEVIENLNEIEDVEDTVSDVGLGHQSPETADALGVGDEEHDEILVVCLAVRRDLNLERSCDFGKILQSGEPVSRRTYGCLEV